MQGTVIMNITESRRYVIVVYLSSWLRFDGKMRNQRMNYCCANSAENLILILIRIWSNLYFCRLKWIIICLDQHSSSMFNQTLQYHFSLFSHLLHVSAIISLLYIYPTVFVISSQLLTPRNSKYTLNCLHTINISFKDDWSQTWNILVSPISSSVRISHS